MVPKGFPTNPGELSISARKSGKTIAKGNRRRLRTDGRAVLRPRTTSEGGEPQGSERSGHGIHWREGGNKVTYLLATLPHYFGAATNGAFNGGAATALSFTSAIQT
jgi:hypothetical protein